MRKEGNMLIDKKAAEIMIKIALSCAYLAENSAINEEVEIFKKIKATDENNRLDFCIFQNVLKTDTYEDILNFAKNSGKEIISSDLIVEIFGGEPHFEKIIGQLQNELRNKTISIDFFHKTVVAHLAVVGEIKRVGKTVDAVYKNGDLLVRIKELVTFPGDFVKIGQKVLIHYAAIISTEVEKDIVEKISKIQAERQEFIAACQYLRDTGIDYENFMDLCGGTGQIIKNCCA